MDLKPPLTSGSPTSSHSDVSPDLRWPSMSDLPSSLPVVNNGPADTSHQIEGSVVKENINSLPVPPSSSESEGWLLPLIFPTLVLELGLIQSISILFQHQWFTLQSRKSS
ncbi:hypothetical protein F2Q69_00040667 [Brassica cretica]|uniref:Uncharacterized protein n=1 Tax=Brassica cretica TaxID=69181 RepID=A0A8S9NH34_BRACR|nr:hypothetical protein F2Q69_00040667 [Brassica cretica]